MQKAHIQILLGAIIWGSGGVFIKYMNLPTTTLSFFRLFIPTVVFFLILTYQHKTFRFKDRYMMWGSVINAVRLPFFFLGVLLTSIGNAWIILYTYPIFVALFSCSILRTRPSRLTWLAIITAFVGVFVMFLQDVSLSGSDFLGMGSMLIGAILSGLLHVCLKKVRGNYTRYEMIFYQNFIGAFVYIPFLFINKLPTLAQTGLATMHASLIGIVAFILFFAGLKHLKATTATTLAYIEVPSAVIFGMIFFGEAVTLNMVIGGTLILGATMLITREKT